MEHLEDEFSLRLLRHIVSGNGVDVNINAIAKRLGIHRATAKSKVERLIEERILDPPRYPFPLLFQEYPLLVLAWADIPRIPQATIFFEEDPNIFAALSCMEGPHNTFLIEFFKDMEYYHSWREGIVKDQKLPGRENRAAAEVYMFSNRLELKYDPTCFLHDMRREFKTAGKLEVGGFVFDKNDLNIFDLLLSGECIHTNETYLAKELGTNRKRIARRTTMLLKEGIIGPPKCYFPDLLAPPKYNLIVSMLEMKKDREQIKRFLIADDHVPRALESSIGRYNLLLFSAFRAIDEFFEWGEMLIAEFPDSIGAMSNTILSSRSIHSIDAKKVSLGLIEKQLMEYRRQKVTRQGK
ncbi:MAG: hypothetical protein KAT70_00890 [Thermoplasmata archaeon]|nr:hypothetical protein [Thermoplasmata archaeon]